MKKIIFLALVFLASVGFVVAAPSSINQVTILPVTDSLYDLGSALKAWKTGYFDELCLTADSCKTTWPTGGGGSLSGGTAGMIASWVNSTTLTATGTPTATAYFATSTTATSTFLGGFQVGSTGLTVLQNGNVGIGTTSPAYPLVIRRPSGGGSLGVTINNELTASGRDVTFNVLPDISSTFLGGYLFKTNNSSSGVVNAMAITAAGNVGIGTTTPNGILTLNVGADSVDGLVLDKVSDADRSARAFFISGTNTHSIYNNTGNLQFYSDATVGVTSGGTLALNIGSTGNIGVATTSYAKLGVTNTGTGPSFLVEDSTSPDTSPFIIDASGNVGVGTASPTVPLSVAGTAVFSSDGATTNGGVQITDQTTYSRIQTFNGEPLVLNSLGNNVGIATTSPTDVLSVTGNAMLSGKLASTDTSATSTIWGRLQVGTSTGAAVVNSRFTVNASNSGTSEYMFNLTNHAGSSSYMSLRNDGSWTSNVTLNMGASTAVRSSSSGSQVSFATGASSSGNIDITTGTSGTLRNITLIPNTLGTAGGGGNVGIATTSPFAKLSVLGTGAASTTMAISHAPGGTASAFWVATSTASYATSTAFEINGQGDVFIYNQTVSTAGNAVCRLSTGQLVNSGNTTCTTSSARFKTNIKPIDKGLDLVLDMLPKSFTRKEVTPSMPSGEEFGFIAEEVNKIEPRLVEYEQDGVTPRGVNYQEYTAVLTKAIQEQQEQINQLKKEIELLKSK